MLDIKFYDPFQIHTDILVPAIYTQTDVSATEPVFFGHSSKPHAEFS